MNSRKLVIGGPNAGQYVGHDADYIQLPNPQDEDGWVPDVAKAQELNRSEFSMSYYGLREVRSENGSGFSAFVYVLVGFPDDLIVDEYLRLTGKEVV